MTETTSTPIGNWLAAERPRERLLEGGAGRLSAAELLAGISPASSAGPPTVIGPSELLRLWANLVAA